MVTNTQWPITKLKGWDKNPRAIKKDDFERLKRQIQKHGQFKPVIVTKDGEVLGGNMRLKAYQSLGISEVWVSVVDPKDEAEKIGIALADNDRAGYYVEEELAELLLSTDGLVLEDYHLDFGKTLSAKDFADNFQPTEEDDFDVEAELPDEPVSKIGDIYKLGEHRLMCGDSTDADTISTLMDGQKADMVFTDPPYLLETEGGKKGELGKFLRTQGKSIDFISDFDPKDFLSVLPLLFRSSNLNAYIFCNKELLPDYLLWARESKIAFNILVWKKPNAIPIGSDYRPDIEYILFFRKNATWNTAIPSVSYSRVFEEGRESGLHPTMKPIAIIANCVKVSSNQGQLLVDLFGGSGSTLIACEQLGRKCYMMEFDPRYVDVIVKRWEQFTGSKAEKVQ